MLGGLCSPELKKHRGNGWSSAYAGARLALAPVRMNPTIAIQEMQQKYNCQV